MLAACNKLIAALGVKKRCAILCNRSGGQAQASLMVIRSEWFKSNSALSLLPSVRAASFDSNNQCTSRGPVAG